MSEPKLPSDFDIREYMSKKKMVVDHSLDSLLPPEKTYPMQLNEAMRYSIFAGGKRLRPILSIATGECLDSDPGRIMSLACALEMIHTYSLINDDLPAMVNDDFRRGRPSCHVKFGEGIAILAGNGLMNHAFQILVNLDGEDENLELILRTIAYLTKAIGTESGVIAGQVVDLLTQGQPYSEAELNYIHTCKTGALINASVVCAAILTGADSSVIEKLGRYGSKIGIAFQIVDDVLDIIGNSKELGKTVGKDQEEKKATYPALFGLEESRRRTIELVREAEVELDFLGKRGIVLKELAHFISVRRY